MQHRTSFSILRGHDITAALVQEQLDHILVPVPRCPKQRRMSQFVLRVNVGALVQEQGNDLFMAELGGVI